VEDILSGRGTPVQPEALRVAAAIVNDVRERGEAALREHAERLGDIDPGAPLIVTREHLARAAEQLDPSERKRLERVGDRIRTFAQAQRDAVREVEVAVPGGRAGHWIAPVERAGCYAPGGRYPLPSSVLMTVVAAREAGVSEVWVASPRPSTETLAAAAIAGADGLIPVGGAQAIAALASGVGLVPRCDVIVGPGNKYVTAAKELVRGVAGLDVPAGPSELVVLADASADPALVAADLLAQAEHDPEAVPVLVTTDRLLVERVAEELTRQLEGLPTADVAERALENGGALVEPSLEQAIAVCDQLAPEHLEVLTADAAAVARRLRHFGAIFIGPRSAEVLGDYGAGPNHVLPTGGAARWVGGLSVLSFLRVRTWLEIDNPEAAGELVGDAAWLGRVEGLEAHARAAERRLA
jgi:phosphoribosyl-ATP pyrophosphohydrolase/phosphoribosyl-AMP cyclohydrolase/histidinol dehydrogenase